jgi:putative redox protein
VEKTMTTGGVRKIAQLEVWIELPAGLDPQAQAALQEAGEGCPVKRSLEGGVPMVLHWPAVEEVLSSASSPGQ